MPQLSGEMSSRGASSVGRVQGEVPISTIPPPSPRRQWGMEVKSPPSYLYWLFCQFELITCSYLMEPWEKVLFYSFNLAMLGLLLYTTYICLAFHASSAFQLLCSFLGTPRENSLAVVK